MADGAQGGVIALPAIADLAKVYNLDAAAFVYTFKAVAMPQPHTDPEFVSCCLVAREHQLNPLTKEIYFMRDKHGKIQAIVSVDGWIKKCNEHPQFDGMEFDDKIGPDGTLTAITCSIFRKDRSRPTKITEYMSECRQPQRAGKDGPWQTVPNRMLRNRTICQTARVAFGFAGIMDRDEFDQWQRMRDITPKAPTPVATFDIPEDVTSSDGIDAIPPDDIQDVPSTATIEDHQVTLRRMEMLLNGASSKQIRDIEADYADAMTAMDEDSRAEAIDMIEAAKAGVL